MSTLHEQFIVEARELILQATDDLLALERQGPSPVQMERVFRAFHTLKGSAGVVELPAMSLTLHAAEDLLAEIHGGRLKADQAIFDQALACLDQVSRWVDDFEAQGVLPSAADEEARVMAGRLRGLLSGSNESGRQNSARKPSGEARSAEQQAWTPRLVEANRALIETAAHEGATALFAVSYLPAGDCFFNGDDPIDLVRKMPKLLAVNVEAREPWPPLAAVDPYACNLRIQAISAADRSDLANIFRLVPDQTQIIDISFALSQSKAAGLGGPNDLARVVISEQREVLRASIDPKDMAGRIGSVARVAANALRYAGRADLADRIHQAENTTASPIDAGLLLINLNDALLALTQIPVTGQESSDAADRTASRSLRVDETRIDALVNLAGELSIIRNSFGLLTKRLEEIAGGAEIGRAVRREYESFNRLSEEMSAAILQLRMVPMSQVFRSFPRLVRDTARKLGKNVELVMQGETTKSDKAIVDRLFEPILHLVRNALDHGIETPELRQAAGKPDLATITLQASRAGDRFVLNVVDDGRGIDPNMVRRRASERHLLSEDELAALSDEQAMDLIFAAGFSTTDAVSDISGRGVGMDVVRNAIEDMSGRVSVSSRVGHGTTVSLDLPLSIAMSQIMIVEAGGQLFGIPMDAVSKTVRLSADRISRIKQNDGFVLDDRVVPLCSLAELMNLPRKSEPAADGRLAIVAEIGGKIAALEVDAIRDRQEVVLKPMQGVLATAQGYAGTTLLGDGAVLLVLDLKEIVS